MKLSVVLVSYNVHHYLAQCLDSVFRAVEGLEADVWVVDNASTDGTIDYLRPLFPQVNYIQNTDNKGFARANNQAIRQSTGEYVLLLNPDTIVGEETLKRCVAFMDEHPEAGATGTKMINRDGSFAFESRRGIPTPATAFYKIIGLCSLYPTHRKFGKYYMRYLDVGEANQIEVVSGAFMMLRRTALEQIGFLDEDYFMYGEDIDLSYCLLQGGWQNWYQPYPILHYKGESTQKTSFRYVHSFYNAMLIFFNKHFARRYRVLSVIIELAVILRGMLEMAVQNVGSLYYKYLHRHEAEPETLLFFGTDEGWHLMETLCRKANLVALCSPEPIFDGQQLAKRMDANPFNYVVFQTDAPGTTYAGILEMMNKASEAGKKAHLGTLNMKTRTLILPNDVIC